MIRFESFCDFSQVFSGFLPFSDVLEMKQLINYDNNQQINRTSRHDIRLDLLYNILLSYALKRRMKSDRYSIFWMGVKKIQDEYIGRNTHIFAITTKMWLLNACDKVM